MFQVYYSEAMLAPEQAISPSAHKPRHVVASWLALQPLLQIVAPSPVSRIEIERAHARAYVTGVMTGNIANGFGNLDPAVAESLPFTSGAMLGAARAAIANGRVAIAPCSGFHHAKYDRGGGFCTFNGLMIAALALLAEGAGRIGILDADMHYGDGTDDILAELGEMRIEHVTLGADFRRPKHAPAFFAALPRIMQRFADCDVLLYQAGADPHIDDPLGGWLTTEELFRRDLEVFAACREMQLPVAWNLAGGYQSPLRKVLDIHDNTMRATERVFAA